MTKLIKYKFEESILEAKTAKELVHKMHELSWSQSKDDEEYMHALADRLVMQSSLEVRYDTPEHFVEDLVKHGILLVA